MNTRSEEAKIFDNPAPPETAWRNAAKWVLWRLLPRSVYQRLLARSKARDFNTGRFREPEFDLVDSLVRSGDTAVDVGANHGMWTLALSRAVGSNGRVFSFEPVPFTFGILGGVTRRDRLTNTTLINKGCSDRVEKVKMTVPLQRAGSSDDLQAHLSARSDDSGDDSESIEILCEVTTLDSELDGASGVSLLKLDIEGAELLALRGAAGLIARERPAIVCEIDALFLEGFGQKPQDVVDFLSQWGYEPHRYDAERQRLDAAPDSQRIEHANVVFLTETHRGRLRSFGV